MFVFFFFKQKTAYEMLISDWSSDVCSSDLRLGGIGDVAVAPRRRHVEAKPALGLKVDRLERVGAALDAGERPVGKPIPMVLAGIIDRRRGQIGRAHV